MNIYIACGLTHVPRGGFENYSNFVHTLAAELEEGNRHEVKYALVNSDPQLAEKPIGERARLCYLWDRRMVEKADLLIAEASFPSTGLGIELQIAEIHDTPIILCFQEFNSNKADPVKYTNPDHKMHDLQIGEGYVTLMALGLPNVYRLVRYSDDKDGIDKILQLVRLIEKD